MYVKIIVSSSGLKYFSEGAVKEIYIGERMPQDQQNLLIGSVLHYFPNFNIHRVSTDIDRYIPSLKKI